MLERILLGTGTGEFGGIWRINSGSTVKTSVIEKPLVLQPSPEDRANHVDGIFQSVHMADFVTIIGGDRNCDDPLARNQQLNDYFRIEMKIVGIALEWNRLESPHGISTVTRVELAETGVE